jgi:predicted Zn-dependent peptidase
MNKRIILLASALSLALGLSGPLGCKSTAEKTNSTGPRIPPDEPWRNERPAAGEATPPTFPKIVTHKMKSGLSVAVIEDHGLPIVDVRLVMLAGSIDEKARKAGLADLTYDMLDEGAGKMGAIELAEAFSDLGTALSSSGGRESGTVSVRLLKRHLEKGVELLATVVQKPTFDRREFERVQKQKLSTLQKRKAQPRAVASDAFAALAYGAKHPYGHPTVGTEKTVAKISRNDAKNFHRNHFGPKNAILVFAGDVTVDEAKKLADDHFGRWRRRTRAPNAGNSKVPERKELALHLVDRPGAPQTMVMLGRPLLKKGDPDEYPIEILNQVLGGMFTSRLNMKLREEKGWTYGARSVVDARRGIGPMMAYAMVQAPHTADALSETLTILRELTETPISDEELQLAKDNIVKSLPGYFETISATAGAAGYLFAFDLPEDHFSQVLQKITAVTKEDVQRVAKRALTAEGMVIVLVGDKASLEGPLKEKNISTIQMTQADGSPVK